MTHWSQDKKSFGYNIPEDLKADTLEDVRKELATAGLGVERGETRVIIPQEEVGGIPTGSVVRFSNGDIQVHAKGGQRRSSDGGRTWRKVESQFSRYACRLSDGETIQFMRSDRHAIEPPSPDEKGHREGFVKSYGWLLRSADSGETEKRESVCIHMPAKFKLVGGLGHARIVELGDGTLIAVDYATFEGDPELTYETWVTKDGIVHPVLLHKSRVFAIRSTDRGKTWHYLATVAFDLGKHHRTTIGGFTESDLLLMPDDRLLCFMRTVGGGDIRPLRMSMSNDGGQTWSYAEPVADRGVCPYACRMENGILAVIYGRPGNWLMFSVDEGHNWVGHFQFYEGPKAYDAWNYCAVEEVAPNTLLAVYGRTDPNDRKTGEIAGTFFKVKPEK